MKNITYTLLLFIISFNNVWAQKKSSFELANQYIKEKGEVVLKFKANNKNQIILINNTLSIGHKHIDEVLLEGEGYANKEQFAKFISLGIPYEVTKEDNEIPQEYTAARATAAWDTSWDAYPKYSEYVAKMQYWATTYPSLCTLQNIGATLNGRALYVLKISDNASTDETEPEFFYTSSMHGDEITGYPTMLRFIDYLLTNYGSDSEVTNLVNGTELFINPLANPDGSYKTAGNDVYNSSGNAATRANANGVDLNRNYGDAIGGIHSDGLAYQPETIAFLNFEETRNFVLAANYHGGTEVVNFPLDTSNTPGTGNFSYHPHDNYFKYISQEYASLCQTADNNLNYMDAVYNTGQFPGTTNGAAWYSVFGGRQDYNNYFNHSKEMTIEVSNTKTPPASQLPFFWDRNRQALLNYVKQASYGLQGIVTDTSGKPIHAKVYIGGTFDNFGSWVETSPTVGDYHKVQIAGTYNVIFEAPGYVSQTIPVTLTNANTTTLNVTMVPVTPTPTASDATICTGQTAALTASGSGTMKWYDSATSSTVLASTATYTTPALTTNTSYWVESEVTPPNVGPTTASGTTTTNTNVKDRYLVFNCTSPTKLKSVLISSTAAGEIYVELQNSTGVMLESKIVRLSASGSQDINLDFFIPAQNGLRLVSREISGMNLMRATTGITYPITSGNISITGNSGTGTFFQFFNWKFAPIKSNRKEVVVTVKPNPTLGTVSPNSKTAGSGAFTLTVNGTNFVSGESIVRWNGVNKTTTFISSTQLTAAITAGDVASSGNINVTIFNTCNSTSTSAQTFTITTNCTAPVANLTNLPTITGECSATLTAPTATSNCYGTITGTTNSPLTYNSQGTFQITWTYDDGNGLISTQNQTIVIDDVTAPVPNVTNLLTVTGQCSVTVSSPTATDNCIGNITATTNDPISYNQVGTYTITWNYNDGNGNSTSQQQSVIVEANQTFYQDLDNDGYGNPAVTQTACSQPVGYVLDNSDCDDTQVLYVDADNDGFGSTTTAACGVANNTDCDDTNNQLNILITFYQDLDNDGYGNPAVTQTACSQPVGYVLDNSDCDDTQVLYVDADNDGFGSTTTAACGVANNTDCDDTNNQLNILITFYQDLDNDGYGNPAVTQTACSQPVGYVLDNSDCDDTQVLYVDADNDGFGSTTTAACGVANNTDCDDTNNQLNILITFYQDLDNDGYGNPAVTQTACSQPVGYVLDNSDCDDTQVLYVDADNDGFGSTTTAACGVANNTDCDDTNNQLNILITFYQDLDNDGYGNPAVTQTACSQPVGYVLDNSDCDDTQVLYVDADNDGFGSTTTAACGVANNTDCDDTNNQLNILITFYQDLDNDGYGNPAVTQTACSQPVGYVLDNSDCDDTQVLYVDADNDGFGSTTTAACGVANNTDCDDTNNQLNILITFYQDLDNDGYGNPAVTQTACSQPVGYVLDNSDCDDTQVLYVDADNDGFGSTTTAACGVANNTDCDDTNNQLNILITFYQDLDNDGYGNPAVTQTACSQPVGYVLDNSDCDDTQVLYVDADNDGFGSTTTAACGVANNTDCDDTNATVYPNAPEICGDNIDNNCNGLIDENCTGAITNVVPSLCGVTLNTINQSVYANLVAGAQAYRFRVTNQDTSQVQTIDKALRVFQLTQLSIFAYNTTYTIEVAVKINNSWQSYGAPCTISTPIVYTKVQNSQCGITLNSTKDNIYADLVSFTNGYRFKITNMSNPSDVQYIDRALRVFKLFDLSNIQNATTYKIEVAVKNTDGTYLPYGTPCMVTTPSIIARTSPEPEKPINIIAYPNPFDNGFTIKMDNLNKDEMVTITVYDLLGREIQNLSTTTNKLDTIQLGENYPAGVYNIIVNIDNKIKTARIIKR